MLKGFLKSKSALLLLTVVFTLIFVAVFYVEKTNVSSAVYGGMICFAVLMVYLTVSYIFYAKKIKRLNQIDKRLHNLENITGDKGSEIEKLYNKIIADFYSMHTEKIAEFENKYTDNIDFYTLWVHQVKTPIFALRLLAKEEHNREILAEITKIEHYTDMVLNYVKLTGSTTELMLKKQNVKPIVKQVLKEFIQISNLKQVRFNVILEDLYVSTDEKWLKFALSQIISNALKYTEKGEVKVVLTGDKLTITDTGIGISDTDLPRIFHKGYTGFIGRVNDKSSGIGLFLCKKSLNLLGFNITAKSKIGKGSEFAIDLSQQERVYE